MSTERPQDFRFAYVTMPNIAQPGITLSTRIWLSVEVCSLNALPDVIDDITFRRFNPPLLAQIKHFCERFPDDAYKANEILRLCMERFERWTCLVHDLDAAKKVGDMSNG